jgi:hypothetical protein
MLMTEAEKGGENGGGDDKGILIAVSTSSAQYLSHPARHRRTVHPAYPLYRAFSRVRERFWR